MEILRLGEYSGYFYIPLHYHFFTLYFPNISFNIYIAK